MPTHPAPVLDESRAQHLAARTHHIVAACNGPGELSAWLYPFAAALAELAPHAQLTTALLPCVFASGRESSVARAIPDVHQVIEPADSMRWILHGTSPAHLVRSPTNGCVLHFGGEIAWSALLARRLHYPLFLYTEDRVRPQHRPLIDIAFMRDASTLPARNTADPGPHAKYRVVGNLMVDAARLRVPTRRAPDATRTIALFPGSRDYQVRHMLPFLIKVAGDIAASHHITRWLIAKSDFVSDDDLRAVAAGLTLADIEGERAYPHADTPEHTLTSTRGLTLEIVSPAAAQRDADFAITIPGTNTAELAALGVPMLMVLPTYHLHLHPLPGLAGRLGDVPILGRALKLTVAHSYLRFRRYWAHPNRCAGEEIVPEMVGRVTAHEVAQRAGAILSEPLGHVSLALQRAMGAPGAAERLAREVITAIEQPERSM